MITPTAALRTILMDPVRVPSSPAVYGVSLPPEAASAMPTAAVVISPAGSIPNPLEASDVEVANPRIDIRCYGESDLAALVLWWEVWHALRAVSHATVVAADTSQLTVLWAQGPGGPLPFRDPNHEWPWWLGSYSVLVRQTRGG